MPPLPSVPPLPPLPGLPPPDRSILLDMRWLALLDVEAKVFVWPGVSIVVGNNWLYENNSVSVRLMVEFPIFTNWIQRPCDQKFPFVHRVCLPEDQRGGAAAEPRTVTIVMADNFIDTKKSMTIVLIVVVFSFHKWNTDMSLWQVSTAAKAAAGHPGCS